MTSRKDVIEVIQNGAKNYIGKGTEKFFIMFNEKDVMDVIQKVLKQK